MNLLLTKHFELKVSDLGISKVAAKTSSKNAKDSYVMTGELREQKTVPPGFVQFVYVGDEQLPSDLRIFFVLIKDPYYETSRCFFFSFPLQVALAVGVIWHLK